MIRTKYLLFAILGCIVVIISAGFFTLKGNEGTIEVSSQGIFSTPNDSFEFVPNTNSQASGERKEFISKIRNDVTKNPIQETDKIQPVESEAVKEEIPVVVPPSDAAHVLPTSTPIEGGVQ